MRGLLLFIGFLVLITQGCADGDDALHDIDKQTCYFGVASYGSILTHLDQESEHVYGCKKAAYTFSILDRQPMRFYLAKPRTMVGNHEQRIFCIVEIGTPPDTIERRLRAGDEWAVDLPGGLYDMTVEFFGGATYGPEDFSLLLEGF